MSVAVIKLGVGNTASVLFALERLGVAAALTDDPARVAEAERVIVPGVGAAAHAMGVMDRRGLRQTLQRFTRPMLGICLGQQLLFEHSAEGDAEGLGLLPGRVTALACDPLPRPHMGWTALQVEKRHALLEGIDSGAYFYFVHSYACPVNGATLASAAYGTSFAAVVANGNVLGCQFHPERSGAAGARLLRNFLALPC
jgi:glutamine amidotransferase